MSAAQAFDWEAWQRDFDELPEEVQTPLKEWYALQGAIIESLGVIEEEWYEALTWALQNPGDMSFIEELSSRVIVDQGDGLEAHQLPSRVVLIGGYRRITAPPPGAPSIRKMGSQRGLGAEVVQRMLAGRPKGGGPRSR